MGSSHLQEVLQRPMSPSSHGDVPNASVTEMWESNMAGQSSSGKNGWFPSGYVKIAIENGHL